ncbi:ribulose-5-phosphate 4-epimerase/fuculose-1-phosphate aldolase [Caulobacter ginsengisoli]|uniref:Ribulose-5-phosphate 4-epimerase/fuculose-1-phosphate aldolase n=1 Tax=Caulobacter ginsengisoli TaxID=400775 RepID=A0ABU0IRY8_9CAUL|nr:class II aldolase/adducin family protein [Caulobacter ginsengisoli]MDQ0463712.1 ribulose-5-phosphate 4-epimerase/fuculose-1-phosphate aldolase [Caulobacter ginsengisoli]
MPNRPSSISPNEWDRRVDLAACYRMIAHLGWDDLIFTHISARVPGPDHQLLINPYGLMFEEVTASNLVRIDLAGAILDGSDAAINPAGLVIHSAVHAARADAECVVHLHTPHGVAVSAQKGGLKPASQTALYALSTLAYHPYEGVALEADEQPRLQADLGDRDLMILENHGLLACGRTVADAFLKMFMLQRACEIQILAQSGGGELITVGPDILKRIAAQSRRSLGDAGAGLIWPAILRKMDRLDPSYRH